VSSIAPPPGEHGGDGARLAAALGIEPADVLDLSLSLNPLAPDVARLAASPSRLDALRRYPDPSEATVALAGAVGIDPDRVVLTNGGAEAIALVAADVRIGWVEEPEFSLYTRHLPVVAADGGRWRSNPRNPTGHLAPADATAAVWDEAFWPLATGTWTRGDADRGAYAVGSLTKVFGCPGLRVGYVLCPDTTAAKRLLAQRVQWSVNGLACALVPELLHGADLAGWREELVRLRARLVELLESNGYDVDVADAPWVMVRDAGDLRERLARQGVLVRDCASFGMAGTVRIAVPGAAGLERLATALGRAEPGR
jgi:histidinol-phosphate/aromatic aminotransferase/cobyric acid decarboxylase-like protein